MLHKITAATLCSIDMEILWEFAYNIVAGRNTLYTRVIELTFKRYVLSPTTGPPTRRFFLYKEVQYEYFYLFG